MTTETTTTTTTTTTTKETRMLHTIPAMTAKPTVAQVTSAYSSWASKMWKYLKQEARRQLAEVTVDADDYTHGYDDRTWDCVFSEDEVDYLIKHEYMFIDPETFSYSDFMDRVLDKSLNISAPSMDEFIEGYVENITEQYVEALGKYKGQVIIDVMDDIENEFDGIDDDEYTYDIVLHHWIEDAAGSVYIEDGYYGNKPYWQACASMTDHEKYVEKYIADADVMDEALRHMSEDLEVVYGEILRDVLDEIEKPFIEQHNSAKEA